MLDISFLKAQDAHTVIRYELYEPILHGIAWPSESRTVVQGLVLPVIATNKMNISCLISFKNWDHILWWRALRIPIWSVPIGAHWCPVRGHKAAHIDSRWDQMATVWQTILSQLFLVLMNLNTISVIKYTNTYTTNTQTDKTSYTNETRWDTQGNQTIHRVIIHCPLLTHWIGMVLF